MWCDDDNVKGILDAYHTGWNPLGTVVMGMCGAAIAVFAGLFVVNRYKGGLKGTSALPGLATLKTQVKGEEYPEKLARVQHPDE